MGLATKVINGKTQDVFTVSTIRKHIKNYAVEAMYQKVDLSIQSRIHDGGDLRRKKTVVYVSWCGDDVSLDDFHHKICYLVTVADSEDIADFIYDRLNDESPASAFFDKVLFSKKKKSIIVCDLVPQQAQD